MSTKIVENDTVRRAVHAIALLGGLFSGYDVTNEEELAKLGQDLFILNNKAVNARYRTRNRAPKYKHGPADPTTPHIQLYKSLTCLIYQCSEDKANSTWLYKCLKKAQSELAKKLLAETEAYKKCGWE